MRRVEELRAVAAVEDFKSDALRDAGNCRADGGQVVHFGHGELVGDGGHAQGFGRREAFGLGEFVGGLPLGAALVEGFGGARTRPAAFSIVRPRSSRPSTSA